LIRFDPINFGIGGPNAKHFPELDQQGRYRRTDCGVSSSPNWNGFTLPGDYHLPFGKAEARAEAAKWFWQI